MRDQSTDEQTGSNSPLLRSWKRVFALVLTLFVLYVVALALFTRYFS